MKKSDRDKRQFYVAEWCEAAFGKAHASSVAQRALRFFEEACETFQAVGCDKELALRMVEHVYSRPVGELAQELGGVGVTLLTLANAAGLSADQEEERETQRVFAKPLDELRARNQAKNDAGFNALADSDGIQIQMRLYPEKLMLHRFVIEADEQTGTECPKRDDGVHCEHWWDEEGATCCSCGQVGSEASQ